MKATLSFNLPEEREEFELSCKAPNYAIVVEDFQNFLRKKLKYESLTEAEAKIYEHVQEEFFDILRSREIL